MCSEGWSYVLPGVGVFFFKQKTAYEMRISDWSSDVCSSDLSSRPRAPGCASRTGGGDSSEDSLVDPQPRIARQAHDPLVEIGIERVGRKAADVQCPRDSPVAGHAARLRVDRNPLRIDAVPVGPLHPPPPGPRARSTAHILLPT